VNKNLAVLISGSYRNFDETWKINKEILDELEIPYEVFFHTWDSNPSMTSCVLETIYQNQFVFFLRKPFFSKFSEAISKDVIIKKFSFQHVIVDKFRPELVCREFNLDSSSANFLLNSQINSCGMYLGIEKLRDVLSKQDTFTHYLRVRTDFILDAGETHKIFDHDLVLFGQLLPTDEGLVGDQCFGGNLLRSGQTLSTYETLKELTDSQDWSVNRVRVLGEDIVRQTLKPLRQNLDILFLDGSGLIKRPELEFYPFLKNPFYIQVILFHNLKLLMRKIIRRIKSLS